MKTLQLRKMLQSIVGLSLMGVLAMTANLLAAPGGPSAAALAKAPANRGRVVGAACRGSDGYLPDYSAMEAKAAAVPPGPDGRRPPINLLAYRDPNVPLPLESHRLPPGRTYCIQTVENPAGYLTSNCQSNADCPTPATCDGSICRAECNSDADCTAPATCLNLDGAKGVRYCRCDSCLGEHDVKPAPKAKAKAPKARRHKARNG